VDLQRATWRKSSRSSGGGNGDCVDVADLGDAVAVRDSKHPDGAVLAFSPSEWRAFIEGAKAGDFDLDR
jgi:Domain of unknown function (DUF397)